MIVRERVEGKKERNVGQKITSKPPFHQASSSLQEINSEKHKNSQQIPKLLGSKSILAGVDTKSLTAKSVYFISTRDAIFPGFF